MERISESSLQGRAGDVLAIWDGLTTKEKEKMIPVLLDRTRTWHAWSREDDTLVDWLRDKFSDAGVAFR